MGPNDLDILYFCFYFLLKGEKDHVMWPLKKIEGSACDRNHHFAQAHLGELQTAQYC